MSRVPAADLVALRCVTKAEAFIDETLGSAFSAEADLAHRIELRRCAVIGNALLRLKGECIEEGIRITGAATALHRLMTPGGPV